MARFSTVIEWLDWQQTLHPVAIELKLERVTAVANTMQLLPVQPCVITVAGTNGKGSTVAILEAILLAAGYRVGCYTSPHLCQYNERIRINQQPVTDPMLCDAFAQVDQARQAITLSYFEFGTLAALQVFRQHPLDVVILEVGMGGRLDAVNIVPPHLAIITTIDLDHTEYLGTTREQIGLEKAGIFRPGRPAVCGDMQPPASIGKYAEQCHTPLWQYQRDFNYALYPTHWTFQQPNTPAFALPYPTLAGAHQVQNASTALMGLQCLQSRLPTALPDYIQGLQQVQHPGRLQRLTTAKTTHILDVAHNPAGAKVLATALQQNPIAGKTYAVFSALADKDIAGMLLPLRNFIEHWFIAALEHTPRATPATTLVTLFQQQQLRFQCYSTLEPAYQAALFTATQDDRIVIFGSFHTVAACLPWVKNQTHREQP